MQYNESQYNGDEYNVTNYTATLTESLTESDATVAFSMGIVKTDSQGTADALSDGVSLAALLDTVTIYQRANTPFAYNNGRYNDFMYNARADEDEILLMATKFLADNTVSMSDFLAPFTVQKSLSETMTSIDATVFFFDFTALPDVVVMDELFSIQITNKALGATIRLNDWLSIEQNPQSDQWGDQ